MHFPVRLSDCRSSQERKSRCISCPLASARVDNMSDFEIPSLFISHLSIQKMEYQLPHDFPFEPPQEYHNLLDVSKDDDLPVGPVDPPAEIAAVSRALSGIHAELELASAVCLFRCSKTSGVDVFCIRISRTLPKQATASNWIPRAIGIRRPSASRPTLTSNWDAKLCCTSEAQRLVKGPSGYDPTSCGIVKMGLCKGRRRRCKRP